MTFLVSILLNVVLLLAFMQASSLHVHGHEATQRHEAAFLHTHAPDVETPLSDDAEWRGLDPDEDAQFLTWVLMVPRDGGLAPVMLVASSIVLPVPVVTEWQTTILRPSAHNPPALHAIPPRAPPV